MQVFDGAFLAYFEATWNQVYVHVLAVQMDSHSSPRKQFDCP